MADSKISALTELAAQPDPTDELVVVDKSDTTDAASGTTKRLKYQNATIKQVSAATYASTYFTNASTYTGVILFITDTQGGLLVQSDGSNWKQLSASVGIPATGINCPVSSGLGVQNTVTSAGTNRLYVTPIVIPFTMTVTGIAYGVGGTSNGNVRAGLFTGDGATRIATKTSNTAQATANTYQQVAFDTTFSITPGLCLAAIIFSSATGTFMAWGQGFAANTNNSNMTIPTTVTPPSALSASAPQLMLY